MIEKLVRLRNIRTLRKPVFYLLKMLGVEIPTNVELGKNIQFKHWSTGTVIHPASIIEDNVTIYQGVTLGRADAYRNQSAMKGILIKEGACLCAGAKILCKEGILTVGKNTVIGANSVLLQSTGDNEIWAGIPAKKIRNRREDEY